MGNSRSADQRKDQGPSEPLCHRKGHHLSVAACNQLLSKGPEALIQELQADPAALAYHARITNDTLINECAKAGDMGVLQVVRSFVLSNWRSLVDTKVVTLPDGLHPSAEAVLSALVNLRAEQGQTALMSACVEGHVEMVVLLMSMGADPWAGVRGCQRTPLHYAALHGHTACVRKLMEHLPPSQAVSPSGVRYIDVQTATGCTSLLYAVVLHKFDIAELLVNEYGADLLPVTSGKMVELCATVELGSTALHVAAYQGVERTARMLCKAYVARHMAEPTVRDPRTVLDHKKRTPYKVAVSHEHPQQLVHMLNPSTDLMTIFTPDELQASAGVPRLAALAAAAGESSVVPQVDSLVPPPPQQQ